MAKPRILIIDDEPARLNLLSEFFKDEGYPVLTASDPTVCKAIAQNDCCNMVEPCADIVISDQNMPNMKGIDFVEERINRGCKGAARQTAISSGDFSPDLENQIAKIGCMFFQKPTSLQNFLDWVEQMADEMQENKAVNA